MDEQLPQPARRSPNELRRRLLSTGVFDGIEHAAYVAVGVLLSVAALIALTAAAATLWLNLDDWYDGEMIGLLIERLLFVLMLVEILHTVRASMRSGGLSAEPFLIVGLIACIRRVLVSTLESSEATHGAAPDDATAAFRASLVELGVLGFLILVMVLSIYLLRRAKGPAEPS
jgi:uncharacterized membrane protein (DUF373 family)